MAEEYEGDVSKMAIFCPAFVSTSGLGLNKAWIRWAKINTVGGLIVTSRKYSHFQLWAL